MARQDTKTRGAPGSEGRQHLFSYRESRQKARNHRQNSHGVSRRHHPAADPDSIRNHATQPLSAAPARPENADLHGIAAKTLPLTQLYYLR